MMQMRNGIVLACVHDVSPRDFARLVEIDRFYEDVGVGPNYAMLVVPNFHNKWSLENHPDFVAWLKDRARAGVEMFLHGFFHRDTTPPEERTAWTKFRYATLGEGEFANITENEAFHRLGAGRDMLRELLGFEVASFVAPAWQYSDGARAALAQLGFTLAENRACVWNPAKGEVLTKTPVIAYSARSRGRRDASILWSRVSGPVLRGARVVRHALHPGDFDDAILVDEIRRSLSELLSAREPAAYRDLLAVPAFAGAAVNDRLVS